MSQMNLFLAGIRDALPVMLGYSVIGLACGVTGRAAGLWPLETLLLSVVLYAGAGQFAFAGMITAAAPPLAIISSMFLLNLRHLLYAAWVRTHAGMWPWSQRLLLGAQLTDESLGLLSTWPAAQWRFSRVLGMQMAAYLTWCAANLIGALGGGFLLARWQGLEFALAGMFAALIAAQLRLTRRKVLFAAIGGLAVLLLLGMDRVSPGPLNVLLAPLAASLVGYLCAGNAKETAYDPR